MIGLDAVPEHALAPPFLEGGIEFVERLVQRPGLGEDPSGEPT